MFSYLRICSPRNRTTLILTSQFSSQAGYKRVNVKLTPAAEEIFSLENFKPKKHPGVFDQPRVQLPEKFVSAFKKIIFNEDISGLHKRSDLLYNYLKSRKLPVEEDEYRIKATRIEEELKPYDDFLEQFLSENEMKIKAQSTDSKIRERLKKAIYHWEPIDYTKSKSLEYIMSRTAGEYAALCRIFKEITIRDPSFQPDTLFDFGSGAGSVLWAAHNYWSKSLVQHICVDISRDMNDIAELILKQGSANNETIFPTVFFRQFLPTSIERKYNLVVSSYTLLEMSTAKLRLETIDKLWRNTNKYLVLVEQGTNSGFAALNEARDYILQLHKGDDSGTVKQAHGHVFSPCPHDTWCPRFMRDYKPCNFYIGYKELYPFFADKTLYESFCYVVLKKGERNGKAEKWPRIVKQPLKRGGHVICRLCTSDGELAETVVTKNKNSKKLYRCTRTSHCGDLLPVQVLQAEETDQVESGYESESESENNETTNAAENKI